MRPRIGWTDGFLKEDVDSGERRGPSKGNRLFVRHYRESVKKFGLK